MPMIYRIVITCLIVYAFTTAGMYWYQQATIEPVVLTECIVGGKVFTIIESY